MPNSKKNSRSSAAAAPCYLICPFGLIGDLFEGMLKQTAHPVTARLETAALARERFQTEAAQGGLVIMALCCGDADQYDLIAWLGEEHPDTNVLIVSSQFAPSYLNACVNAGADGFLYADMSSAGFLASLELLAAGEKVLPSRLAAEIRQGDMLVTQPDAAPQLPAPSTAAVQDEDAAILRAIASGAPNKIIAAEFSITEASVKMRLRQIFARLGVQNRTQAATWAIAQGLYTPPLDTGLAGKQ